MDKEVNEKIFRCKTSTDANKLAGSMYLAYQEDPSVQITIRVIGAGSLNQAIKAVIISNKFFAKKGLTLGVQPYFQDAGTNMTAIGLNILLNRI